MGFQESFKALSDPSRRDILMMLKKHEMNAGEIANKFEMSQATVSYHLSILKKAELIKEKKEKNYIYYSINSTVFEEMMLWVTQFMEINHEK